ncbi:ATP--guanido phosphotransferase [Leptospira fluminis]|uniref:ATP--guanido phosphotransferase n=1 Tax=Leptospira fluminis TaxID=2484979 RepID=A0A4R9GRW7_9LEPT|nr:ATP--guanido phosphotransferase [Leptospira fluminis]TGK20946.1 ATP--guanido phosphotransferase [Leptospira fluminis]
MESCVYCGISASDWKKKGRVGCSNCVELFREEYLRFIPRTPDGIWEPPTDFPMHGEWKELQSLVQSERWKKIDSYSLPFSYRYRVARNPKGSVYPVRTTKPPERFFLDWFSGKIDISEDVVPSHFETKKKKRRLSFEKETRISWKGGTLFTGDEDHFRWEYVTDSLADLSETLDSSFIEEFWDRERFDYKKGIGFLTSCPTNSGEGDKFSVAVPDSYTESGILEGFRLPTDWGFYREEGQGRLIFFRKNFGRNGKNSFFNLVSYLALLVILGKEAGKASSTRFPF